MSRTNLQWITQKEASEISGKNIQAIHKLTKKGLLRIKEVYGKRLVNRDDILNYKPKKVGRPRKENLNNG